MIEIRRPKPEMSCHGCGEKKAKIEITATNDNHQWTSLRLCLACYAEMYVRIKDITG